MTDPKSLPYRPCVGMMVLNQAGQVFVGRRIDTKMEAWQMPQGGIDEGEDIEGAALRELEEEIGTRAVDVLAVTADWLHYDLPADLIGRVWGGRYRGQRQKWFAMRLRGGDELINIETHHPEFNAWRWEEAARVPEMIVPFKRPLYREVMAQLGHLARPVNQ